MWPLSCYAYFKEMPCLPGLADLSPEELRWEAYRAHSSGNTEHFLKSVSQLNEARLKTMHEFSNLTVDDVKDMVSNIVCLHQIYLFNYYFFQLLNLKSGDGNGGLSSQQGLFAPSSSGTTVSSLFGNATPSSSLFGSQKPTGSSLFQSSPPPNATTSLLQPPKPLFGDIGSQGLQLSLASDQPQGIIPTEGINPAQHSTALSNAQGTAAAGGGSDGKLTEKELEAFKADKFTLGQIPEHAPPDLLCN